MIPISQFFKTSGTAGKKVTQWAAATPVVEVEITTVQEEIDIVEPVAAPIEVGHEPKVPVTPYGEFLNVADNLRQRLHVITEHVQELESRIEKLEKRTWFSMLKDWIRSLWSTMVSK